MPNIESAKKRMRVSAKQTEYNKIIKTKMKSAIKTAKLAVTDNADNAEAAVKNAIQRIDIAVSKGVLHDNTAARKKSKLVKSLNNAS